MIGNGVETYSDSTLKSMKKDELIEIIRVLESNLRNSHETNDIQYHNCIRLLKEEKEKALDEFAERLKEILKGMQMVELQGEDVCPCSGTGEECPYINQDIGCQYCAREQTIKDIDEIAEQLRGE